MNPGNDRRYRVFRREAVDRLADPRQSDQLGWVAPACRWPALAGAALVLLAWVLGVSG